MATIYTAVRSHRKNHGQRALRERATHRGRKHHPLSFLQRYAKQIHRRKRPKSVIVVGAGFAGLAAAYELDSVGYDVTVLEAQDEPGGRVRSLTDFIRGRIVEGGAELIGSNHYAWLSYRHLCGLHYTDVEDPANQPVLIDNKLLSTGQTRKLQNQLSHVFGILDSAAKRVIVDAPWRTKGAKALDRMPLLEAVDAIHLSPLCRRALLMLLVADNGVEANRQSYLGVLAMIRGGGLKKYWADTEVFRCAEGNQALAWRLAGKLPLAAINFECTVKSISISKKSKKVIVRDKKGNSYRADNAILAIPPSVWKKIRFHPALPPDYRGQFGKNVKYLMNVAYQSWSPRAPSSSTSGPVDITWRGTDHYRGPRAELVAFSGSKDAMICRKWKKPRAKFLAHLARIYPKLGTGMQQGRLMDWPRDPWTHGSYSFPAPGEVTRTGPLLQKPFRYRLHFAGEHTCYAFVGYMEGALQSGLRVAEYIARRDRVIRGKVIPTLGIP